MLISAKFTFIHLHTFIQSDFHCTKLTFDKFIHFLGIKQKTSVFIIVWFHLAARCTMVMNVPLSHLNFWRVLIKSFTVMNKDKSAKTYTNVSQCTQQCVTMK